MPAGFFLDSGTFQSTLPRGERHDQAPETAFTIGISIHAPARGATYFYRVDHEILIFQSTLPRGERRHRWTFQPEPTQFQSTLPRGERRNPGRPEDSCRRISIHAPARGATLLKHSGVRLFKFQSTLPRGERRDRVLRG